MKLILVMAAGIVAGLLFVPKRFKPWNTRLQTVCTVVLIFFMGVSLGSRKGVMKELSSLGFKSLVFAAGTGAASVWFVYWLTKRFFERKGERRGEREEYSRDKKRNNKIQEKG